jgi:hypothetical protein
VAATVVAGNGDLNGLESLSKLVAALGLTDEVGLFTGKTYTS